MLKETLENSLQDVMMRMVSEPDIDEMRRMQGEARGLSKVLLIPEEWAEGGGEEDGGRD